MEGAKKDEEKGRESDLIPGIFSCVGRQTNRGMDKLRQAVKDVITANQVIDASKGAGAAGEEQRGTPPAKKANFDAHGEKSTSMGRAIRERMGITGAPSANNVGLAMGLDDDYEETKVEVVVESPKEAKSTVAFAAPGKDQDVYNEVARANLNRFFRQSAAQRADPGPPIGRYRPQYGLVSKRVQGTDIKEKAKHPSRRIHERLDDSCELGPLNLDSLDFRWTSTSSSSPSYNGSRPKLLEQMTLSTKRPDLRKLMHVKMTDITEPAGNRDEQDLHTTNVSRQPEWNFKTPKGRGGVVIDSYFEAGKYKNKYDLVEASPKKPMAFHKNSFKRSATTGSLPMGRHMPKMMMTDGPGRGTANHPDRSLFRSAPAANKRVTHVMEFEKDIPRPPLIIPQPVYHDTSNPDHCAAVHERAMTDDANTFDRAVRGRQDKGPRMHKELSRHRAGRGSRISQNDICYRSMLGHTGFETTGQMECSVEESKEAPSRLRADTGISFDQSSARSMARTPTSPLRRPREALAPEFARVPQQHGLDVRTSVTVVPRSRTHDPLPGWNRETLQALEMEMEEDDKYMRSTFMASSEEPYQDPELATVAA